MATYHVSHFRADRVYLPAMKSINCGEMEKCISIYRNVTHWNDQQVRHVHYLTTECLPHWKIKVLRSRTDTANESVLQSPHARLWDGNTCKVTLALDGVWNVPVVGGGLRIPPHKSVGFSSGIHCVIDSSFVVLHHTQLEEKVRSLLCAPLCW